MKVSWFDHSCDGSQLEEQESKEGVASLLASWEKMVPIVYLWKSTLKDIT